jgi:hypothetical protein
LLELADVDEVASRQKRTSTQALRSGRPDSLGGSSSQECSGSGSGSSYMQHVTHLVLIVDILFTLQCIILKINANLEQSNSVQVWIQIQILSCISQAK